ncbi:uncharacterized protein LOC118416309 isoform X1 [Branchiostoma floridae]|uniref:Uncharacterized protein LOC118416309 isoform X1 n=2 Tax=Branchiostoma floridae TaxID=7739 RepID=A0A9J7L8H4_BRAFL|nr:uncharacterized protein LOC118416309 isoform X1 [Branchiostoma floridae]
MRVLGKRAQTTHPVMSRACGITGRLDSQKHMIQTTLKATTDKMTAGLETTQAVDVQKAGVTMETLCEEELIEVDGEGVVSQGGKSAAELLLTALQNMDASQAQALVVANMAQFDGDATVPDVSLSQDTGDSDLSSLGEGSLTPIIKEELKYTIQTKRLASGLDELDVEEIKNSSKAKKPRKISPEEEERRRVRRERNRIAAAKCRNKKRERGELLQEESERLESQNERLKSEISRLQEEKEKIAYLLQFHRPTCIMKAPATTCAPVTTTSKPTAVMVDSFFSTASSSDLSWDSAETGGQETSPSPAIVPVDLSCAYSSDSDSDTELS